MDITNKVYYYTVDKDYVYISTKSFVARKDLVKFKGKIYRVTSVITDGSDYHCVLEDQKPDVVQRVKRWLKIG